MSTSDVKKEGFWTRTLNYGRTVLPNTMKSGVLGIISNNKVTLAHLVVAMTMVGLELFLNAEVFNCPLKNHVCYGLMFLTDPPCIIFVVNLLIVGRIWTLSNRCCVKEYRRKGECFFYVFPNVVKALVGGLVWLMVAFIDTRYFVCAVVGQDINKRNLTDSEEIKSLQHQIDHAKGLSHVFAWVVFLVMVVFGVTVVIVKRCYRKAHVLAAGNHCTSSVIQVKYFMVYHEEAFYNYFIPCHRKYSVNTINVTYARSMIGRLDVISSNIQRFPRVRIGCIFLWHGIKVNIWKIWTAEKDMKTWFGNFTAAWSCVYKCDDQSCLHIFPRTSNVWSFMSVYTSSHERALWQQRVSPNSSTKGPWNPHHFWVALCLCVKTSLHAELLKCVPPTCSFLCKSNSFSFFWNDSFWNRGTRKCL